jgi:hypothetical protein
MILEPPNLACPTNGHPYRKQVERFFALVINKGMFFHKYSKIVMFLFGEL